MLYVDQFTEMYLKPASQGKMEKDKGVMRYCVTECSECSMILKKDSNMGKT